MLIRLFPLLLLLGPLSDARAHDPGLSHTDMRLGPIGLTLHMRFARQDLAALVRLDTDLNGDVSDEEISTAQTGLISALAAGVNLRQEGTLLQARSVLIEPAPDAGLNADLHYDYTDLASIQLDLPLIAQLARGHRHHLNVRDTKGKLLTQHLLDAASPPVLLQGFAPGTWTVFRRYLAEGIRHIWIGSDHILFLLTLLLPSVLVYRPPGWRHVDTLGPAITDIVKVVTAFTLAHSLTLGLAVMDIFTPPSRWVESAIAFSVLFTALNNLRPLFPASRWLLAFGFGLLHGFGFAGVLLDLGLPTTALTLSLLGFNLGVEIGQIAIVALAFPAAAFVRDTRLYRIWIFKGGSAAVALVAVFWLFERAFVYSVFGI